MKNYLNILFIMSIVLLPSCQMTPRQSNQNALPQTAASAVKPIIYDFTSQERSQPARITTKEVYGKEITIADNITEEEVLNATSTSTSSAQAAPVQSVITEEINLETNITKAEPTEARVTEITEDTIITSIQTKETLETTYITNSQETTDKAVQANSQEVVELNNAIYPTSELDEMIRIVEVTDVVIKPVYHYENEVHSLTDEEVHSFLKSMQYQESLTDNRAYGDEYIAAMLDNYKMILETSSICCTSNLTETMKQKGFSSSSLVNFLVKDVSDYNMQGSCLIINNDDINDIFGKGEMAYIIQNIRKSCICSNKRMLEKTVDNFFKIYMQDPSFAKEAFIYRHKDKQGRVIEHNINETILNISETLEQCM